MNDYELVYMAQEHIEEAKEALYEKYKSFLDSLALNFYKKNKSNKIDIEDIKLECMMVFEKVIDNYDQNKDSKFFTYLWMCLDTKLKDILRSINSNKQYLINTAISIDEKVSGIKINDLLYNSKDLVENKIINNYTDIDKIINYMEINFSNLEIKVLKLLLQGYSKEKIANRLKIDIKKVYNAVYRIKIKLKKELVNGGI